MADDVKWIKLKVGMFDGESFKKIKRAKIGGEKFRDKLTAVWFELMDFAGKCNHNGAFINSREIPYTSIDDIATMIDREPDELELCMQFFINEGMVEIIDNIYLLANWAEYQNMAGLDKIREGNRARQAKFREKKKLLALESDNNESNVTGNVTPCDSSYSYSLSNNSKSLEDKGEYEGEYEGEKKKDERHKRGQYGWVLLTDTEYDRLCNEYGKDKTDRAIAYVDESAQLTSNKNKWKDWNLVVRRCIRDGWGQQRGANNNGGNTGNSEPPKRYGTYV